MKTQNKKKLIELYVKSSKPEELFSDLFEKLDKLDTDIGELASNVADVRDPEVILPSVMKAIEGIRSEISPKADSSSLKSAIEGIRSAIPSPYTAEQVRDMLAGLTGKNKLSIFDLKDIEWLKDGLKGMGNGSNVVSLSGGPATSISGLIQQGTNITITGLGTTASPYVISSTGGSGGVTSFNTRTGAVTSQSGDYNTSQVAEVTNLYFTNARAIASTLTGYVSGAGIISSADSVLSAIQKLNGNIGALVTGVSSVINSDGTLTISPTTGAVVASIALGHANTWSALQTFGNNISIGGATVNVTSLTTNNVLQYNGTNWVNVTLASSAAGANPTATIGLTVVNGSAATFLRSDGAPALSQAIAPTWTGVHIFSPAARTSGVSPYFTINAPADTGITTATEAIGIKHTGATRTWVDGTVAVQREYFFGAPTYNKTTTSATFTQAGTLVIGGAPVAGTGVTITNAFALWVQGGVSHFGAQLGGSPMSAQAGNGIEVADINTNGEGVTYQVTNTSNGTFAYGGLTIFNDTATNPAVAYAGIYLNSSGYTNTTFGTAVAIANQLAIQNATGGPLTIGTTGTGSTNGVVNILVAGFAIANEVARFTAAGMTIGLTGTLTGSIVFAGATSTNITLQGQAIGSSTTLTLPAGINTTLGYLGIPQNSQSANYTTVLSDSGVEIYHPVGDANARTFTIAANASVAYPIGTSILFTNMSPNNLTIAINTDTLYLEGAGTTGSRTLAQYGSCIATKKTSTTWLIGGTNLT